jgi:glucose-1-phosphate cytidylyltransferase
MVKPKDVPILILAGGLGTRLAEETSLKPKPMVEIGDIPILIHIMRHYLRYGFNDFVICAGYKSWEIKRFFVEYRHRCNHLELDHREFADQEAKPFSGAAASEKWRVRVLDTGELTMTGGRVALALDIVSKSQDFDHFGLTYGDGVSDINLTTEFSNHIASAKIGTVLGVRPKARFGELDVGPANEVLSFAEKPRDRQGFVNGGYFFFKRSFREYLSPEESLILERAPLERLARDGALQMFPHEGFWHPMDTLSDRRYLESLWTNGEAPWRVPHKAT